MLKNFKEVKKRSEETSGEYIIGFDFSLTSTGCCVLDKDGEVVHTTTIETSTSDGILRQRLDYIYSQLKEVINAYPPVVVNYEMISVRTHFMPLKKILMSYTQLYRAISDSEGIDPYIIPVAISSIKKVVTGDHTADKNVILKETLVKWGINLDSDDVADAHGAARVGLAVYNWMNTFCEEFEGTDLDEDKFLLEWDKCRVVDPDDEDMYDTVNTVMMSDMTVGDNL